MGVKDGNEKSISRQRLEKVIIGTRGTDDGKKNEKQVSVSEETRNT